MDIEKLNNILDEVFTPEIDDVISKQKLIGVRLSGGIDSAFMTFLTMSKYPNIKILPITMFNKLRPAAMDAVDNVINTLKLLNPNNNNLLDSEISFFDSSGFVKTQEMIDEFEKTGKKYNPKDIFQRNWFYSLWKKYENLNIYFSGETLNPPIEEQPKIITGELRKFPEDRNHKKEKVLSKRRAHHIQAPNNFKYEFRPFRNKNKKQVAQWVKSLGLDKTLFPVTETCETEVEMYKEYGKPDFFNLVYKKPGAEPCKRCWPCREKYWAYGYYDFGATETINEFKL